MDAWQKLRGSGRCVCVFLGVFGCLAIDGSAIICVRSSGKNHASHRLAKHKRRKTLAKNLVVELLSSGKTILQKRNYPVKV